MVVSKSTTANTSKVVYYPLEEDGAQFRHMSASVGKSPGSLPHGYPKSLGTSLVWKGDEIVNQPQDWVINLDSLEANTVHEALHHFETLQLDPSCVSKDTFPLPDTLAQRLRNVSKQCYEGTGFCIVRGIEPRRYTTVQNVMIFAGLSAYIAPERGFQDKDRTEVLCHVVSRAQVQHASMEHETPAFTQGALSFHTDYGEILALSTLEADEEGEMLLASSWQIYNELAATRPDIIHILSKDWVWDTYADYAKMPPFKMPLIKYYDNKLITHFSRYPLTGFGSFKRNPDLPPITTEQMDALNAMHFIARRNAIKLPNLRGDIVYINNMALLHARQPLSDKSDHISGSPLSRRHRLKLFLRDPEESWSIPPAYQRIWTQLYGSNTDSGSREEHWMLEPEWRPLTKWASNG